MSKNEKITLLVILCLSLVVIAGGIYFWWDSRADEYKKVTETFDDDSSGLSLTKQAIAGEFAAYQEYEVNIDPKVEPYSVESDFSNITNYERFTLNEKSDQLLIKNNFVVVPGYHDEFFSLYEGNRYDQIPSFITTDSVLHNYHLFFDSLLKKLEKEKLYDSLIELTDEMLSDSEKKYEELKDTGWSDAAKRNIAFFSVAKKTLDEDAEINDLVKEEVEADLALMKEHQGIQASNVVNIGQNINAIDAYREDFSQYVPRGHYTKTEELKKYFKAMMWYGRINWRLKKDEETRSAVLMTQSLRNNKQAFTNWEMIFNPVSFFVGKTDDLTYYNYDLIYGQSFSDGNLTDNGNFEKFVDLASKLDKPQINSMPIFAEEIMPDRAKEIFGWRFMGQRYTVDAEIFQHLIDREVQDRMLPKSLDIAAAFGSELAAKQLKSEGDFEYENYEDNLSKMQKYVSGLKTDVWTQNLYWGWLYGLTDLLELVSKEKYPSFMTNQAWEYKDLQTFVSSWTELKHDTILYAKQVYAELGGGPMDEGDDRGYVEPRPYVYARLASLVKMTSEGLQVRGLINEEDVKLLDEFEQLVLKLKNISEKELNGEELSEEDYKTIKFYGGDLEHLWLEVYKDEGANRDQISDHPAALVADVATDPNGEVLEQAIGKIDAIYVVFPIEGKLKIGKGGVFSHYEFKQPIGQRLTDEEWYAILHADVPERAEWHDYFLAD